jgi:prepilin-type processing-associated H-X9-DG protein
MSFRHNGGNPFLADAKGRVNILYMDGHVGPLAYGQIPQWSDRSTPGWKRFWLGNERGVRN